MNSVNEIAGSLVGIPFKEGGRDRRGVDCYGLLLLFMKEWGIDLPDFAYDRDWYKHGGNLLIENYHEHAEEISTFELRPGDVIMIENYPGVANHLGIFLGHGKFLHAVENETGSSIARMNQQPHSRRIHSCYRMKRKS